MINFQIDNLLRDPMKDSFAPKFYFQFIEPIVFSPPVSKASLDKRMENIFSPLNSLSA